MPGNKVFFIQDVNSFCNVAAWLSQQQTEKKPVFSLSPPLSTLYEQQKPTDNFAGVYAYSDRKENFLHEQVQANNSAEHYSAITLEKIYLQLNALLGVKFRALATLYDDAELGKGLKSLMQREKAVIRKTTSTAESPMQEDSSTKPATMGKQELFLKLFTAITAENTDESNIVIQLITSSEEDCQAFRQAYQRFSAFNGPTVLRAFMHEYTNTERLTEEQESSMCEQQSFVLKWDSSEEQEDPSSPQSNELKRYSIFDSMKIKFPDGRHSWLRSKEDAPSATEQTLTSQENLEANIHNMKLSIAGLEELDSANKTKETKSDDEATLYDPLQPSTITPPQTPNDDEEGKKRLLQKQEIPVHSTSETESEKKKGKKKNPKKPAIFFTPTDSSQEEGKNLIRLQAVATKESPLLEELSENQFASLGSPLITDNEDAPNIDFQEINTDNFSVYRFQLKTIAETLQTSTSPWYKGRTFTLLPCFDLQFRSGGKEKAFIALAEKLEKLSFDEKDPDSLCNTLRDVAKTALLVRGHKKKTRSGNKLLALLNQSSNKELQKLIKQAIRTKKTSPLHYEDLLIFINQHPSTEQLRTRIIQIFNLQTANDNSDTNIQVTDQELQWIRTDLNLNSVAEVTAIHLQQFANKGSYNTNLHYYQQNFDHSLAKKEVKQLHYTKCGVKP